MQFEHRQGTIRVAILVLAMASAPAIAGIDVDFGARVQVGDHAELFIDVSSRYFDQDRRVVETLAARHHDPDDLAVALFIGRHSGRSADYVFSLRRKGLSWWDVSVQLGLPADVWFVEVRRDPGPPYGKAYGHWKKHKRDRSRLLLTDVDARNLVAVRMLHEYYGVSVDAAMEWRASGRDVRTLMIEEYHRRHVKSAKADKPGKPGKPAKNKGHSKGRGRKH